jgi:hypothetical protein
MPLDVEAVATDPVAAGKGCIILLAEIFGEAGSVALDKSVQGATPFADDIDGTIELGRPDQGPEAQLLKRSDQSFASLDGGGLFGLKE